MKYFVFLLIAYLNTGALYAQVGRSMAKEGLKAGVESSVKKTAVAGFLKASRKVGASVVSHQDLAAAVRPVIVEPEVNFSKGYASSLAQQFGALRLSIDTFGEIAKEDHLVWMKNYMQFTQDLAYVKENARQIAASLDVQAYKSAVPYGAMVPADVKTIFIGEQHDRRNVPGQIVGFIDSYREAYPDRQIIVLTEFLQDSGELLGFGKGAGPGYAYLDGICPDDLLTRCKNDSSVKVLRGLMNRDIGLEGLEGTETLLKRTEELGLSTTNLLYMKALWSSAWGMRARNLQWARFIQMARKKYPEAVLLVYGGSAHMGYNFADNLPGILKEKNSFVITFSTHWGLPVIQGFSGYTAPFENAAAWNKARWARQVLVRRLTDPQYRRYMGADINVVVPGLIVPPPMPTKSELK